MLFRKLNGRIHEIYKTQKGLADSIGVTPSYISKRMQGKVPFTVADIKAISNALDISADSIGEYFFK